MCFFYVYLCKYLIGNEEYVGEIIFKVEFFYVKVFIELF